MKLIAFGEDGWLVAASEPAALAAAIDRRHLDEVVPGERHVLLRGGYAQVRAALDAISSHVAPLTATEPIRLPARWEGPDLADVAESAGMTTTGVIEVLRQSILTVAFCGFSPGFGYLTGLDRRLHLPRRDRPRTRVPAGSIAIAAGYCAVYPNPSPGGWHLIGHCDSVLFTTDREPPALLSPGDRVRFV